MNFLKQTVIVTSFIASNFAVAQSTINDAIKLIDNEQFEAADNILNTIIGTNPKTGDAYFYKGYIQEKSEQYDKAKEIYQQGLAKYPSCGLCYVGLGRVELANKQEPQGNFNKAMEVSAGKDINVMNKIGEAYLVIPEKANHAKAIEYLDKAQKYESRNIESLLLMGDAFYEKDPTNGTEPIKFYNKAQDLDPKYPRAVLRKGQMYARGRNFEAALAQYDEALKLNPNFAPAYREQGDIYYRAKLYSKAKESYDKFLSLSSQNKYAQTKNATLLYLIAKETKSADDFKLAAEKIEEVSKLDPSVNYLNRLAAYSYAESKQFEKAQPKMDLFFENQPQERILPSDYLYQGKILKGLGKDSLAIMPYNFALQKDPKNAEAYSELASIYLKRKQYKEAIYVYQEKEKNGLITGDDYLRYGISNYAISSFVEADSCFAKLNRVASKFNDGYMWRGRVNAELDKEHTGLAVPHFEKYLANIKPEELAKAGSNICESNKYLAIYYNETAKDNTKANAALQSIITTDVDGKLGYKTWAETAVATVAKGGSLKAKPVTQPKPKETPKAQIKPKK